MRDAMESQLGVAQTKVELRRCRCQRARWVVVAFVRVHPGVKPRNLTRQAAVVGGEDSRRVNAGASRDEE